MLELDELEEVLSAVIENDDWAFPVEPRSTAAEEILKESCQGAARFESVKGSVEMEVFREDASTCHPVGMVPPTYQERCCSLPAELLYSSWVQSGSLWEFVFQSDSNST